LQTETPYTQEHSVDERTGVAACHLALRGRMRKQFKRPNACIAGHLDGDWNVWLTKPLLPSNYHHQLGQTTRKGAPECALSYICERWNISVLGGILLSGVATYDAWCAMPCS
jgi:hypothetical protein